MSVAEDRAAYFAEQRRKSDENSAQIYRQRADRARGDAKRAQRMGLTAAWWYHDREAKRLDRLADDYERRAKKC